MSTNNDELLYDEDDSVKFIQNYLPQELKGKFSNDDINYIVDLIYDFYESNGMLDDDGDDEIEIESAPAGAAEGTPEYDFDRDFAGLD